MPWSWTETLTWSNALSLLLTALAAVGALSLRRKVMPWLIAKTQAETRLAIRNAETTIEERAERILKLAMDEQDQRIEFLRDEIKGLRMSLTSSGEDLVRERRDRLIEQAACDELRKEHDLLRREHDVLVGRFESAQADLVALKRTVQILKENGA